MSDALDKITVNATLAALLDHGPLRGTALVANVASASGGLIVPSPKQLEEMVQQKLIQEVEYFDPQTERLKSIFFHPSHSPKLLPR